MKLFHSTFPPGEENMENWNCWLDDRAEGFRLFRNNFLRGFKREEETRNGGNGISMAKITSEKDNIQLKLAL